MPGYGYAKLSKKKQEDFNTHVSGYLLGRDNLKQIFVLVDSQLEPLDGDLAFIDWLQDCELPYSVILPRRTVAQVPARRTMRRSLLRS